MKQPKLNKRKCVNCGEVFQKVRPLQNTCDYVCAIEHAQHLKEKQEAKGWKERKRATKEKLKTKQDYEKELQTVFNTFIRKRDKGKPCISCNRPLIFKFDAGHFFPMGSYKNLRFNEDNCHAQCVHCNQHKHGNLNEYTINLPNRIGTEAFNQLIRDRLTEKHYSIPELIELKVIYKDKIKKH